MATAKVHEEGDEVETETGRLMVCFVSNNGEDGDKYYLDKTLVQSIAKETKNSDIDPATCFVKYGMDLIPILIKENSLLSSQVSNLQDDLRKINTDLIEVTNDRNKRGAAEMKAGTVQITEHAKVVEEKEAREKKIKELTEQLDVLKQQLKEKNELEEIYQQIEAININTNKIDKNVDRIWKFWGITSKSEPSPSPIKQLLAMKDVLIVVIGQKDLFSSMELFKSLNTDVSKMEYDGRLMKIKIEGQGLEMAKFFVRNVPKLTKKAKLVIVVIIDGAECAEDEDNESLFNSNLVEIGSKITLGIDSMSPGKEKQTFVIAGPRKNPTVDKPRQMVMSSINPKDGKTTMINMTKAMKENGGGKIKGKWEEDGLWSSRAIGFMFAKIVNAIKGKVDVNICKYCGCLHDGDVCFEKEVSKFDRDRDDRQKVNDRSTHAGAASLVSTKSVNKAAAKKALEYKDATSDSAVQPAKIPKIR